MGKLRHFDLENQKNKISCPCCKNKNLKTLYKNLYDKIYFIEGKFTMLQCTNCKFEFIIPKLKEKDLSKYYPSDNYYSLKKYNRLATVYHNFSAKYWLNESSLARWILRPLEPLFYTYYGKRGQKVLEVGCGSGMKLEIYKKNGFETKGIEPHGNQLTKKEESLGISRDSIKNSKFPENNFDIIILKEVIEHVPDQETLLNQCYKWLKPQGIFIITTQNANSLWKKVFTKNWAGYDVPRHLYNYNNKNLSFILKKHKFKILNMRNYDNPYMIDGSIQFCFADKFGNHLVNYLVSSNILKLILTPLSLIISYFNSGSLMEIKCTKQN